MAYWTFLDFRDGCGENAIRAWLDDLRPSQRKRVKVKLNTRLRYLEETEVLARPYTGSLHGYSTLFELRLEVNAVQYRPLCCHGPDRREVTLLAGAIERGGVLLPLGVAETALARRALVLADRRYVCEHDFN